jgi:hypothetical protein
MAKSIVDSILSLELFNPMDFLDFLPRIIINLVLIYIIAFKIYYHKNKNKEYLLSMIIFNLVIFVVCYTMSKEKLSIGFSFGLFAVFSILRYRTEAVPIKEMTYMFVSISMAVLNALSSGFISIGSLIASDLSIVLVIFLLERIWTRYEQFKFINYEKIELIKPPRREELISLPGQDLILVELKSRKLIS